MLNVVALLLLLLLLEVRPRAAAGDAAVAPTVGSSLRRCRRRPSWWLPLSCRSDAAAGKQRCLPTAGRIPAGTAARKLAAFPIITVRGIGRRCASAHRSPCWPRKFSNGPRHNSPARWRCTSTLPERVAVLSATDGRSPRQGEGPCTTRCPLRRDFALQARCWSHKHLETTPAAQCFRRPRHRHRPCSLCSSWRWRRQGTPLRRSPCSTRCGSPGALCMYAVYAPAAGSRQEQSTPVQSACMACVGWSGTVRRGVAS